MTRAWAWLFTIGWLVFWIGAFTPPWRQWMAPPLEALRVIGTHRVAWHFINGCFVIGIVVTAAGFVAYASTAPSGSARFWAVLAASGYSIAVTMFLINLAFRHTVTVWAAENVALGREIPLGYGAWSRFSGLLFGFYSVLAYSAVAAFGASLLRSSLLPRWIGWANLTGGLALAALAFGNLPPANAPLMVHLGPGLAGLLLLWSGRRVPFRAS